MAGEACASRKGIVRLGCTAGGRVAQKLDDIRNRSRGDVLADKGPAAIAEGAEPILIGAAALPATVAMRIQSPKKRIMQRDRKNVTQTWKIEKRICRSNENPVARENDYAKGQE